MKNSILFLVILSFATNALISQTQEQKLQMVKSTHDSIPRSNVEPERDETGLGGVDFIQNISLYNACFTPYNPFLLMGGEAEVVFDQAFIELGAQKRFFGITYEFWPEDPSKKRTISVKLPLEVQKVIFSKKVIFEDQGIPSAVLDKLSLDKESVLANQSFKNFQLICYREEEGRYVAELERELAGFILPDDESLRQVVGAAILRYRKKVPTMITNLVSEKKLNWDSADQEALLNAIRRLYARSRGKIGLRPELLAWIPAFEQVLIEEIRVALVSRYGYNFENDLRAWLAIHFE